MPVVSDETEPVLNDEVLGRATALSRRAAHQFAELPMAQAALEYASARHANEYREIDHASASEHQCGECQPRGADSVAGFAPAAAGLRARFARDTSRPDPETAR
jgi:hypothetical protein